MSELGGALRDIIDSFTRELHTCLPAKVVSYDAATQTCAVQPQVKRVVVDEEGNESVESLPQIVGVPVGFYVGGGFMMTFPVAAGDTGLLIFSELPIDTWLNAGKESDPGDLRHHALGDAFFAPIVRPTANKLADASADTLALGKTGGPQIHVNASTVNIGEKVAAAFIARADKSDAQISNLKTYVDVIADALAAYAGVAAPFVAGPTIAAAKITATTGTASTAATKGKVT